jgi:hypothetical protein
VEELLGGRAASLLGRCNLALARSVAAHRDAPPAGQSPGAPANTQKRQAFNIFIYSLILF